MEAQLQSKIPEPQPFFTIEFHWVLKCQWISNLLCQLSVRLWLMRVEVQACWFNIEQSGCKKTGQSKVHTGTAVTCHMGFFLSSHLQINCQWHRSMPILMCMCLCPAFYIHPVQLKQPFLQIRVLRSAWKFFFSGL